MDLSNLKTSLSYKNSMCIKISEKKLNHKNDECKRGVIDNSLKINNQSISTGDDEIKDVEIKASLSQKNLNNSYFINRTQEINKKNINLFSNDLNERKFHGNEKEFKNKILTSIYYRVNNIILFEKVLNCQKEGTNINKQKIDEQNKEKIKAKKNNKESKKNDNNKINKNKNNIIQFKNELKSFPPKIPFLLNNTYKLYKNGKNNFCINNSYDIINRSEVPNVFYNHMMAKDYLISNKNLNFYSLSTTKRVKGKLLTIVYFAPKKKI